MKLKFFDAPIGVRTVYALISALLWWAIAELDQALFDGGGPFFYATGAVFSALVLLPYLPGLGAANKVRALGLILIGPFSYYSAVFILEVIPSRESWFEGLPETLVHIYLVGVAGVYGAMIIGLAARLLIPRRLRWQGWLFLAVAGGVGGALVGTGLYAGVRPSLRFDFEYWLPGHMAWQVLICLALYYGAKRAPAINS